VPRQALDIDYCARTPADCLDEYKTLRDVSKKNNNKIKNTCRGKKKKTFDMPLG
jgi:hypothetical protein